MTKKLMMLVAAVVAAFGAWAETETVGGYTWTYQINGDTAEIYNHRVLCVLRLRRAYERDDPRQRDESWNEGRF